MKMGAIIENEVRRTVDAVIATSALVVCIPLVAVDEINTFGKRMVDGIKESYKENKRRKSYTVNWLDVD